MKIEYEVCKRSVETFSFEVEDEKNCFLQGRTSESNRPVWLGIWIGEDERLHIVKLRQDEIEFMNISGGYVTLDIKQFLERNQEVEKISKEKFMTELDWAIKKIR